jgi:hypothetical protein
MRRDGTRPASRGEGLSDPWAHDAALAERCLAGEESAWRELVDCHSPPVFSLCLATGLSSSEAEDVCQEVLLSALRSLRTYGGCRLSTWLYRITRRPPAHRAGGLAASGRRPPAPVRMVEIGTARGRPGRFRGRGSRG